MPKQNRRSINLPTDVYEELSFLQAETRLLMKENDEVYILSKTSMTGVLKALIKNTSAADLVALLSTE